MQSMHDIIENVHITHIHIRRAVNLASAFVYAERSGSAHRDTYVAECIITRKHCRPKGKKPANQPTALLKIVNVIHQLVLRVFKFIFVTHKTIGIILPLF